jgi:hypothetical protein
MPVSTSSKTKNLVLALIRREIVLVTPDSVNEKPLTDPIEAAGQARREMVMEQRLIRRP